MEAIRRIVMVRNNKVTVELPESYNNKAVELIILEPESVLPVVSEDAGDYFSKYYGKLTTELTDEEIDLKLKSLRNEWSRDIS